MPWRPKTGGMKNPSRRSSIRYKGSVLSKSQIKIWTEETGPGEKDHQKR